VIDGHRPDRDAGPRALEGEARGEGEGVGTATARDEDGPVDRGERRADGAADLCDRRIGAGHRRPDQAWIAGRPSTRSTHRCGSVSSSIRGSVSGLSHTRLNPSMPARSTTPATNA